MLIFFSVVRYSTNYGHTNYSNYFKVFNTHFVELKLVQESTFRAHHQRNIKKKHVSCLFRAAAFAKKPEHQRVVSEN